MVNVSNVQPNTRLLTPRQVGDVLGVSRQTVYRLIAGGRLTAVVVGAGQGKRRNYSVHPDDLSKFIERNRT